MLATGDVVLSLGVVMLSTGEVVLASGDVVLGIGQVVLATGDVVLGLIVVRTKVVKSGSTHSNPQLLQLQQPPVLSGFPDLYPTIELLVTLSPATVIFITISCDSHVSFVRLLMQLVVLKSIFAISSTPSNSGGKQGSTSLHGSLLVQFAEGCSMRVISCPHIHGCICSMVILDPRHISRSKRKWEVECWSSPSANW